MKKVVCLLIAVLMLLLLITPSMAAEISFAERMFRQIEYGSGLKGSISLEFTGDADWAQLLSVFNGADLQLRAIRNRDDGTFQIQLYAQDEEEMPVGKTWIYGDLKTVILSSPFLPEKTLKASIEDDLFTGIFGYEQDNPLWYSALYGLMTQSSAEITEKWEPLLAPYYNQIEMWLAAFATDTKMVTDQSGRKLVQQVYTVPADALKDEALTLLNKLFSDNNLLYLLRKQLTGQQQDVYLNVFRPDYYQMILRNMPLEGNAILSRSITTTGETVEIDISLPLYGFGEWKTFNLNQKNDITTCVVMSDTRTVSLDWCNINDHQVKVGFGITGNELEQRWDLDAAWKEEKSTDADGRRHHLIVIDAEASVNHEAAWKINADLHFSGKNNQTSPTKLQVTAKITNQENTVDLNCTLDTVKAWVFDLLDTDAGILMTTLTEEEKLSVVTEWISNAYAALQQLTTQDMPLQVDEMVITQLKSADSEETEQ